MVLGFKQGKSKTRIGSRNVVFGVAMWVIGYEFSTRPGGYTKNDFHTLCLSPFSLRKGLNVRV